MRRIHIGLRTGVALGAMMLVVSPVIGLNAGASGSGDNTPVNVAGGISPANVSGAVPFGTLPTNTPEEVSFILDENNANQLQNQVESGVQNFLTVSQFAAQYGQSSQNVTALTTYLSGFGISTTVLPDMIDVNATGTAGQFDAALSVVQNNYHAPGDPGQNGHAGVPGQTFHGPTTSPQLPRKLAKFVLSVLGLTNYSPFTSDAVSAVSSLKVTPTALNTNACIALVGLPSACNTPQDFESNYGLTRVAKHANGSGQTIAIITLASMDPGSPQYFWSNVLGMTPTGRTVTQVNVDGGSGAPSFEAGSTETDLDVEQSGAIAPGANVIVYQAPNTDYGFVDAFAQAASQNIASSYSASWGEAESLINVFTAAGAETTEYQASFDEVFEEMAMQGQTGFVSAGDAGAYDNSDELGTTDLNTDSPGDSPYITTAGGTTLPWTATFAPGATVTVSSQRAWAWDYLWAPLWALEGAPTESAFADALAVGGGGGYSQLESTPYYQQGVSGVHNYSAVPWLTPTDPQNILGSGLTLPTQWNFNATPSVITGTSTGRATPDLSTDADPESGYLEYSASFAITSPPDLPGPVLEGGWGGTSFVAPQLNGSAALIDSALGYRTGFWNPDLYWAASHGNSPFTPLNTAGTSNDNLFYTGTPGTVFNPATGLGVPDLGQVMGLFEH
jgi:subtilase family serine protease